MVEALRSASPMLVVPWAHDQPGNAARLVRRAIFESAATLFHKAIETVLPPQTRYLGLQVCLQLLSPSSKVRLHSVLRVQAIFLAATWLCLSLPHRWSPAVARTPAASHPATTRSRSTETPGNS